MDCQWVGGWVIINGWVGWLSVSGWVGYQWVGGLVVSGWMYSLVDYLASLEGREF